MANSSPSYLRDVATDVEMLIYSNANSAFPGSPNTHLFVNSAYHWVAADCFLLEGAFRQNHFLPASLAHCPFLHLVLYHKLTCSLQVYKENYFRLSSDCSFAK